MIISAVVPLSHCDQGMVGVVIGQLNTHPSLCDESNRKSDIRIEGISKKWGHLKHTTH